MNLARLRLVIRDSAGNGVSGVTCEVRKQGANAVGVQSGSPITVDAIGGVIVGDSVVVNTTSSPSRDVTAISATTMTLTGLGHSVIDDDRLTVTTNLPSLFVDVAGNEALSNPGTTDSTGTFTCYLVGGAYDIKTSGGGTTTKLHQDIGTEGVGSERSNVYSGTAYQLDTLRALAVTDEAFTISENSDGNDLFKVMGDGEIITGIAGATHSFTGTSLALIGAAGTSTLTPSASNVLSTSAGITAATGNITATTGNIAATAGDFDGRRVLGNNGTALVSGDFAHTDGAWGVGHTFGVDANSYDMRGSFFVVAAGTPSANPSVILTFHDGAFPVIPVAVCCRVDGVAPSTAFWVTNNILTTDITFQLIGTPTAGNTYYCRWIVMG